MQPDPYSFATLHRHYRACRRNKRNTSNALRFELNAEAELFRLQEELRSHTYRPGPSICFVTGGPKPREVFAADFRDRIVHHVLVAQLERVFEPKFIADSFACRRGKGVLAASDRLMTFLRRITANGRRPARALKLDVSSFFASIHKETLYRIVCRYVADPEMRWLTRVILFHDPTTDYRFKPGGARVPAPYSGRYPIPKGKSLFGGGNERGLPIGNLTSQFWANVYLNPLDQFVKRELKCRYYLRYVDDLVLLHEDADWLRAAGTRIASFVEETLLLSLRDDGAEPRRVSTGVEFVGWRTWWTHRRVRRRTLHNLDEHLAGYRARLVCRMGESGVATIPFPADADRARFKGDAVPLVRLRSTLASYAGHLRQGAAWRQWEAVWDRHEWLDALYVRRGWTVAARCPAARRAESFARAYAALARAIGPDGLVFVQVGRYIEFFGSQRLVAQRVFGLRPIRSPRAGYALTAGFPIALLRRFVLRALAAGYVVVQVAQTKGGTESPVGRRVTCIWYGDRAPIRTLRRGAGTRAHAPFTGRLG
ncbi:hypothetical protein L6Q96_12895 [Candidatus Binatia bacterium]|nr:hypothetical protein [Candidatus Binatia bacterium]